MKLFPTVARLYMDEAGRIRTPHSRTSYLKVIRFCQSQYPELDVDQFTSRELTDFCLSRGAAPSTIRNRRAHVRSTFEWAAWRGLCSTNPAADLKFTVVAGRGRVRDGTWLTEHQVRRLLDAFDLNDERGRRDRIIVMTGLFTGLRLFELAALDWNSFSSDLSTVKLRGKGDKWATLGVPAQLREALVDWRALAPRGAAAVFPSMRWSFDREAGENRRLVDWSKPLGEAGIGFVVTDAGTAIGITLRPHDLRRTFAGLLEAKGLSLKQIQDALRHENLATTDRYLQANPARTVAVVKEFRLEI